jgi:hypothetical protein
LAILPAKASKKILAREIEIKKEASAQKQINQGSRRLI